MMDYNKCTGKDSRIEKKWSEYLDKNFGTDFLLGSDKIIRGEVCQRYRPDKYYASPKLIIQKECDEHQHIRGSSYECDEKRISDIYDENPGKKHIITRWNPDTYKPPEGRNKLNRTERLELDLYVTQKITKIGQKLPEMFIIYMFYDKDNELLSKNIPHIIIYSKEDFDLWLKSVHTSKIF